MTTFFETLFELCPPLFSDNTKKWWVGFRVPDLHGVFQPNFWENTIERLEKSSAHGISRQTGASARDQMVNKKFDVSADSVGKIVKFHTPINLRPNAFDAFLASLDNSQQRVPNAEPPRPPEATGPRLILDFQQLEKQRR